MPRFNEKTYDPRNDSSEGFEQEGKLVVLHQSAKIDGKEQSSCLCGCGHYPHGRNSSFMMGHDARFRGALIRAHLTDTPVVIVTDDPTGRNSGPQHHAPIPAAQVTDELGLPWAQYLESAEARREGKNRQVLAKAVGSERLIKVGRWEKTGQVIAFYEGKSPDRDEYEVEYVTKTGDVKRTRVPVAEAKEVK